MSCCFNVTCFLCFFFLFIGITSLAQLCLGIYTTLVETDITSINYLIRTDKYDSYLFYILLAFVGLGFIALVLTLVSIYGISKRRRSLSLFVTILWVFTIILNLAICVICVLYYFQILPQLSSLLFRSLRQHPLSTSNALHHIQSKYSCCGIVSKDDYHNLALDPLPSSCCRLPNCWNEKDLNTNGTNNNTMASIHPNGCYPIVQRFVLIELWILFGIAALSVVLQFLIVVFMCVLSHRYRKHDDDEPKFAISHLVPTTPINENVNNNNNNNENFDGSQQTIVETVEVTQI